MSTEQTTTTTDRRDAFKRRLRALESVLARQARGQGWSTTDPRAYVTELWELVQASDQVAEMLDTTPALAARFIRAERRANGMAA